MCRSQKRLSGDLDFSLYHTPINPESGLWRDKPGKENHETLIRPDLWAKETHTSGDNAANANFDYAAGIKVDNSNFASVSFVR